VSCAGAGDDLAEDGCHCAERWKVSRRLRLEVTLRGRICKAALSLNIIGLEEEWYPFKRGHQDLNSEHGDRKQEESLILHLNLLVMSTVRVAWSAAHSCGG